MKNLTSCTFGVEYQMHYVRLIKDTMKQVLEINLAMDILTKYLFLTTMQGE